VSLVLDSNRAIAEVARSIDVHEMTLGKWVNKEKQRRAAAGAEEPLAADERDELERLRAENATLKMERDFAKKVATWFAKDQP
jgi:transposase